MSYVHSYKLKHQRIESLYTGNELLLPYKQTVNECFQETVVALTFQTVYRIRSVEIISVVVVTSISCQMP